MNVHAPYVPAGAFEAQLFGYSNDLIGDMAARFREQRVQHSKKERRLFTGEIKVVAMLVFCSLAHVV